MTSQFNRNLQNMEKIKSWNMFLLTTAAVLIPIGAIFALRHSPLTALNNHPNLSLLPKHLMFAPPPPIGGKLPPGFNFHLRHKEYLNSVRDRARKNIGELHQQLKIAHHQMRSLIDTHASLQQLQQQHEQIQFLHHQIDNANFETMLAERQLSEPEPPRP